MYIPWNMLRYFKEPLLHSPVQCHCKRGKFLLASQLFSQRRIQAYMSSSVTSSGKQDNCLETELQRMVTEDSKILNQMAHLFPEPKKIFNNYLQCEENMKKYKPVVSYTRAGPDHKSIFCCTMNLGDPAFGEFSGYGSNKKIASSVAVMKLLCTLYEDGQMTLSGSTPAFEKQTSKNYSRSRVKEMFQETLPLTLSSDDMMVVQDTINQYKEKFEAAIQKQLSEYCAETEDIEKDQYLDLITGRMRPIEEDIRAEQNRHEKFMKISVPKADYEISAYRMEIIDKIDKNQIVIVVGGTGSGKSTQVPQIIFDNWILNDKGSECNIVVSQPRRIAAISIAQWISKERNERPGRTVGYKMRMEQVLLRNNGGIVYYTTGSLLRVMTQNPLLKGISHIILDEIHERTMEMDVLMSLIKDIRDQRPDLKIILMSATLDFEKLSAYFDCSNENVIKIPGNSYPLQLRYITDLQGSSKAALTMDSMQKMFAERLTVPYNLIVDVVKNIHENKPQGAILVFVPGWQDILKIEDLLLAFDDLWVLPLHSSLSVAQQRKVFETPPEGLRKVVLATNIAETSITIADIVYVVDSGLQNTSRYHPKRNLSSIGLSWITKANAIQRAGRAGRVGPGEVCRIYSKSMFDEFEEYPMPEIVEQPLENIYLKIKTILPMYSVSNFLQKLPDPPQQLAIKQALSNLCNLGMIKIDLDGESLTHLGRCASGISTDPDLAKALIYASVFRCLEPTLNTVAFEKRGGVFSHEKLSNKEFRHIKELYSSNSDFRALSRFASVCCNYSRTAPTEDEGDSSENCELHLEDGEDISINLTQLKIYLKTRDFLLGQLQNIFGAYFKRILNSIELESEANYYYHSCLNKIPAVFSCNDKLFDCCITASSCDLLRRLPRSDDCRLYSESGSKIVIRNSSVLTSYNSDLGVRDLAVAGRLIFSQERMVTIADDLCTVMPITAALFFGPDLQLCETLENSETYLRIKNSGTIFETAECIMDLRKIIREIVDFTIVYSELSNQFRHNFWETNSNDICKEIYNAEASEPSMCSNRENNQDLLKFIYNFSSLLDKLHK